MSQLKVGDLVVAHHVSHGPIEAEVIEVYPNNHFKLKGVGPWEWTFFSVEPEAIISVI